MKVSNLDHLNLTVKDLDETKDWYKKVFGFEEVESGTRNGVRWSIIRSGDAMLCIYEHPELKDPYDNDGKTHKIYHFGLRISDREDFEKKIQKYDLPLEYGGPIRYPSSWSWYISDPTGYEIEVALWDANEVQFAS